MGQPVVQFQILARNPDALTAFYAKLFGWQVNADNAMGYRTVDTGSDRGINGGVWPIGPTEVTRSCSSSSRSTTLQRP